MQCAPCAAGTYSLGQTAACAPCAPAYSFVGATVGCAPPPQSGPTAGLAWAFSGAAAEGFAGFSAINNPGSITNVADRLGVAGAATQFAGGAFLASPVAAALPGFPTGGAAASISAWVNCAPFATNPQASVVEWGFPGAATSNNKLAISVAASSLATTSLPGPVAGVCDSKWHHLALTYGDGSATALKQYTDGVLLAQNPSFSLSVVAGASALRVGTNGGNTVVSFTTVGTTSWTVPPGVTSINVLVVAGGGGGGSTIDRSAGGAGAGGMICRVGLAVTPGQVFSVTVGAGGPAAVWTGGPATDCESGSLPASPRQRALACALARALARALACTTRSLRRSRED
jgi:hypothetical protein